MTSGALPVWARSAAPRSVLRLPRGADTDAPELWAYLAIDCAGDSAAPQVRGAGVPLHARDHQQLTRLRTAARCCRFARDAVLRGGSAVGRGWMTTRRGESEIEDAPGAAERLMEHGRPRAAAGAVLARARVLGALFGHHAPAAAFGRFHVLDRLGAGGMGVVYEAYDPDLARGVALKIVDVAVDDRQAALAEAKALARLSHPNVVPIYDVGLERDHVYLVMELVRGQTLAQSSAKRTVREILAVYHQAGTALAAAHGAGLVHRDFKPQNAIVGADGRVRVVDFGLACEADVEDPMSPATRRPAAGTPHFMAPEIKAGAAVTPAADQYSFCVALADALAGAAQPMPRRIAGVLERGRAAVPAERFASMTALLHALARDPARTRRRAGALAGAAIAVGAIAFVVGRQHAVEPDVCDDGDAQLAQVWNPADRSAALERIATLSRYGASLGPQLARALDGHASSWVRAARAACLDRHRRSETDTTSDRRTICLRRSSDALAAVRELMRRTDGASLFEVPRAVQAIPDPAACSDAAALASDVAPPPPALADTVAVVRSQVIHARVLVGAGRYPQAAADAADAVTAARRLGYEPVLAEALLVQGHAEMNLADRAAAVPTLTEATRLAVACHADALAIEAWARRAYAQGMSRDPEAALAGLELIEPLAQRTASAGFARALLYNNLGSLALGQTRKDRARDYFERALDEAQHATGRGALELVNIRGNLALVIDDRARADQLLVDAVGELTSKLGADHPDTLAIRQLRGLVTTDDLGAAASLLTEVCPANELHAALVSATARCWAELGFVRAELENRAGALAAMERAARTPNEEPSAAPYATLWRGDAPGAARQFAKVLAALPPPSADRWWVRDMRAELAIGLGRARRQLGDLGGARDTLAGAIADLEPIVRDHPGANRERRLGRARIELASALAVLGDAAERAAVAAAAEAWARRAGVPAAELAALRALQMP
jgi:predicted Ser/Thr protein kinase